MRCDGHAHGVREDTGAVPVLRVSGRHGGDLIWPCSSSKGKKQNLVRSNRRGAGKGRRNSLAGGRHTHPHTRSWHLPSAFFFFFLSFHRSHHIPFRRRSCGSSRQGHAFALLVFASSLRSLRQQSGPPCRASCFLYTLSSRVIGKHTATACIQSHAACRSTPSLSVQVTSPPPRQDIH
jgi:hypothetical protein